VAQLELHGKIALTAGRCPLQCYSRSSLSLKDRTEELRHAYARISDDELRLVKRNDLSDLARQCYDEEVARRGLNVHAPSADAGPEPETDANSDVVAIETFSFPGDAQLARALLESAGIPSYLENEHTLAANWMLINVIGGLRLLVPSVFAEEARDILRSRVSDQDLTAQAEAAPKPPDA